MTHSQRSPSGTSIGAAVGAALLAVAGLVVSAGPAQAAPGPAVGTVFIADGVHDRVVQVPPGGGAQTALGAGLDLPDAVAVSAAGDVFISDFAHDRVVVLPAGGGAQFTVGSGLHGPGGVAVNATGDVFISDSANNRVVVVPAGGGAQFTVGIGLNRPLGVAVDAAGDVFIADTFNNRVVKVPAGGGAQSTVGTGLNNPRGVAVDAAGDVFIGDFVNNRVVKVPAGGGAQSTVGTGLFQPRGPALDAAGNVYIADSGNNRVVVVPADGGAQFTVGTGLSGPTAVAVYAPAPTFTANTPPTNTRVGAAYSYTYTANTPTGEPAATFALFAGALPPGLSLDPVTGVLSGTPTTPGIFSFTLQTQNVANATIGPATTITVGKGVQAITFTSTRPANPTIGGTYQVSATGGGSGNPVVFSIDSSSTTGACTISAGGLVSFTGAGTCVVDGDQAGDANYVAAPQVSQSLTVAKVTQAITFTSTPAANPTVGDSYQAAATGGGSGNPVIFSIDSSSTTGACTISAGGLVSLTGAGTCVVDANQAGDATYAAAPQVTQSLTVAKAVQAITFTSTPPASPTLGGSYQVTATGGGSGNPVLYSIDSSSTSGACTITTGGLVSFTGPGTCVVDADQAGDANYVAAPQVSQSVTVAKVTQEISFTSTPPADLTVGDTYQVTVTGGGSVNPVTFTVDPSSTPGACTVTTDGLVGLTGPGTCVVDADQAGDATHAAAPQVAQSLTVNPAVVATPPTADPTPAAAPTPASSGPLAFTGTNAFIFLMWAGVLMILGVALLLIAGHRRARPARRTRSD
jgi:Putative Ig domain/NHL repeat